jgi:hypothetical protein
MDIPNSLTLLPTLGAALIIAAGETAWINHTILSQRSLVWLGLISYPLYLWHWPLLSFSRILLGNADSLAVVFGTMAVSTVLAWITYKFIETPFRKGARGSLKVMILLAAMLLVGSGGYYSYRRNGFPSRFPSLIRELMDFSYAPPKQWERDGAFLTNRLDDEKDFRADTAEIDRHKPTIYLWGDSHANALYPGYKTCFGPEYNVIERAAASTPPLLGVEFPTRPNGRRINQYIFDSIVKDKPDVVVLAADWSAYDWEKIEITITQLKKAGIGHIVLVGPTPEWIGSLPEQLFNYSRRHHFAKIPKRMSTGLKEAPVRTDKAMAAFARRVGVEYISPCQILGNEDGFLTRVGDTADTLLVFDSEHLTVAGSEYLVSHFPKD